MALCRACWDGVVLANVTGIEDDAVQGGLMLWVHRFIVWLSENAAWKPWSAGGEVVRVGWRDRGEGGAATRKANEVSVETRLGIYVSKEMKTSTTFVLRTWKSRGR